MASVILTEKDRLVLESYKQFAEGLSDYIGDGYEIVLHSLESYDHSVIKIINGFHTGRKEGAPITDLALNMLAKIESKEGLGYISYFSKNSKNEPLKSSTITIRGEHDRIIGLMCINFYLNTPLNKVLSNFIQHYNALEQVQEVESFVNNPDDLINLSVAEVRSEVYGNPEISINNKNKEIIVRLHKRGIFSFKDAVYKTASILGISKNTVYMHIRNLGGDKNSGNGAH